MKTPRPILARNQRGAALIVVLILLLVMTLLGLASLRGTIMEERMSANMYDRSLAFQAVEAALREAETLVSVPGAAGGFPSSEDTTNECQNGLCDIPLVKEGWVDRWEDESFEDSNWQPAETVTADGIDSTPEYIIEYMGEGPSWPMCDRLKPVHPQCLKPRFRITARLDTDERAYVMLQSNYVAP